MLFGNWSNFLKEAGYELRKPQFSKEARLNSIKSRLGKKSGNSKGGKIKDKFGYVQIWMPNHPNAKLGGYIHEHRLVMSNHIGRPLERYENVHHKNGDRSDNTLENLELWDTTQPSGQRLTDKIKWAKEILLRNGFSIYENPELLTNQS